MSIRDVPVFAEHETTTKDGRTLRFGRTELEAVANRCNRRIAETGDYAALSIGHTPPAGSGLPPLKAVGFAGPFRVASMSGEMGRERYAITADFHVRRSEWEEAQKYIARRSPELWVEDTYDEMFLDPIALLGAEVPRLDMGLVYSRVHPGKLVEKYAAVFEGPGNVHIPQKDYAADNCGTGDGGFKAGNTCGASTSSKEKPIGKSPDKGKWLVSILKEWANGKEKKLSSQQTQSFLRTLTRDPGDFGLSQEDSFSLKAASEAIEHALATGRIPGQAEKWFDSQSPAQKVEILGHVTKSVPPAASVDEYYQEFRRLSIANSGLGITENYEAEGDLMLDDQDLARIVDAIQQLPQWQFLESQMMQGQGAEQPGVTPPTPVAPGAPPAAGAPPGAAPPPAVAAAAPPPAENPIPPAGAMPAAPPQAAATAPAPPQVKGGGLGAPGGDPGLDAPGGDPPQEPPDKNKEKDMAYQKACYAALDAMEDEELTQYMAGRKKRSYAAESHVDGDDQPDAEAGTYDQTANEAEGVKGSEHTIQEGTGGPPRKESEKMAHSRSSGENETLKYERDALKARVAKLESESQSRYQEKTDANRRARLLQLHHEGYVLDPDKMMERLCYSKMRDDSQFDGFVDALLENTPRAPLNLDLPYVEGVERYSRHRPGTKSGETEKYSKEDQDRAYKAVMARTRNAPPTTDTTGWYEQELQKITNGAAA